MLSVPKRLPLALAVVASMLTVQATATTVVPITFDELVQDAREIFIGEVVARQSRFVETSAGRAIVTLVTFRIDEGLKGGLQTQTSIEFLGGTVGDVRMEVVGLPEFIVGDRDVLFISNRNEVSPVTGFMQGRFRIMRDPVRGIDTIRAYDGRAVSSIQEIGQPKRWSMTALPTLSLTEFRAAIVTRLQAGGAR